MTQHEYISAFIQKHSKADWNVETSGMDRNGKYVKWYNFSDGGQIVQVNEPVWETAEAEVRGVKVQVSVKLFRTEMWNTDDAKSVFWYEKY